MIYIYTEDTGSGKSIWELLLSSSEAEGIVEGYPGNVALASHLCALSESSPQISTNDIIIVSYDNYCNDSMELIHGSLRSIQGITGCQAYVSTYGCIECAFLTFKYLWDWVDLGVVRERRPHLLVARDTIINSIDDPGVWLSSDINMCGDGVRELLLDFKRSSGSTRLPTAEKIVSSILSMLTNKSGFSVRKKYLGPCWRINCCWGDSSSRCNKEVINGFECYKDRLRALMMKSILSESFKDTSGKIHSLAFILERSIN